ncbi:MAG TPA: hypothetical protein VHB23_13925 [Devosiaceae bacterium]|jgi:hypothetical protein|nr:hypothetical protein [Devosiaceae bacterium]
MSIYFFDCYDGPHLYTDPEGLDCEGPAQVGQHAIRLLLDIARDNIPDGARFRRMRVIARDDAGTSVLETRLVFSTKPAPIN